MTSERFVQSIADMAIVNKGERVGLDVARGRAALLEVRDPVRALAIRLQSKQWEVQEPDSDGGSIDRTAEAIEDINRLMGVLDQLIVDGQLLVSVEDET